MSGWSERRGQRRGLLLIVLTACTFALLLRNVDLNAIWNSLKTIPPGTWLLATLLTGSFPILSALRWHLTLRAIGHRVSVRRCLTIILGTFPISAIAPSKAGDLLKAVSLRKEISVLEVGGTVLAERAFDVLFLALLSLTGSVIVGNAPIIRFSAVIAGAGVVGLLILPLLVASVPKPKVREKLQRAIRVLGALQTQPGLALGVFALTAVNWLASIVQTHLLLVAVGASTPFTLTISALPIAIFVGLIPVTVAGMGTRDATLITLLAPTASASQALTVGLLYSLFGTWLLALLGLPFLNVALFAGGTRHSSLSGSKNPHTIRA